MSITSELRAWAREHQVLVGGLGLEEIADRIDEGQAQLEEDLDLVFGKSEELSRVLVDVAESLGVDTMLPDEEVYEALLESAEGCIPLPKDADGKTIHIADYLHSDENGKDFPCRGFELTLMHGVEWWTVECCYDSYSGTSEHVSAKSCHHVKPDNWERIIEDAQADGVRYHNEGKPSDFDALVERCKRLAGEDA